MVVYTSVYVVCVTLYFIRFEFDLSTHIYFLSCQLVLGILCGIPWPSPVYLELFGLCVTSSPEKVTLFYLCVEFPFDWPTKALWPTQNIIAILSIWWWTKREYLYNKIINICIKRLLRAKCCSQFSNMLLYPFALMSVRMCEFVCVHTLLSKFVFVAPVVLYSPPSISTILYYI